MKSWTNKALLISASSLALVACANLDERTNATIGVSVGAPVGQSGDVDDEHRRGRHENEDEDDDHDEGRLRGKHKHDKGDRQDDEDK